MDGILKAAHNSALLAGTLMSIKDFTTQSVAEAIKVLENGDK